MMTKYNPGNERMKRDYFRYQKEAKRKSEGTIAGIRKAILRFESYTGFKSFQTLHKDQIIAFKEHLSKTKTKRTGESLSKSTMLSTTIALKDFFGWLMFQTGFKSRINGLDIEYFNLSEKDTRTAKAGKFREFPTLEQVRKVILSMPRETDLDRRNRALVAFTILTGMRDSAIATLRLKHIDLERDLVRQEPDQVKTKFGKRIDTFFFPVGDDIKAIVIEWVRELMEKKLFGLNDPVFPRTKRVLDSNNCFKAEGVEPECWANASPIREVFKDAFFRVGIAYFSPHTFRHTLVHMGQTVCNSPEEFKAWSQNLGHEHVMTTFNSYGNISPYRQGEIIRELAETGEKEDMLRLILRHVKDAKKARIRELE